MPESLTRFSRRRTRIIAVLSIPSLVLVLAAGYRWYPAGTDTPFSAARIPRLARSGLVVVPGVYLLGGLSPSAAYVIETSQGLVLVDSGLDRDARPLKSQMTALGLDWKRVRVILLTHAHGDHTGGAEALRTATGARVYAGAGDALVLKAGQPREAFFSTFSMPDQVPHATKVDVALDGGETVTIGDARIQVIAAPGHTPGSICYLLERKNLRALFAGDVIMMLRGDEQPRTELGKPLGTYSAYLAPRYRGDARAYLASLRRLRSLPVPDLVLPGHPGADLTPQSPRLSPERWESLLDQGIRDMEVLLTRYEANGALFLDGIPKQLLPDLYYLGNFRGAAVYGFFASSKFFLVDAPGGLGLVDFLKTHLQQLGREPVAPTAVLLTSCSADEIGGLNELIEIYHPQIVASSEGLESLKKSCPAGTAILSEQELTGKGWFAATPIPLRGPGFAPMAYQVAWAGKTTLFSGRIPVKINQEAGEKLISDLTNSRGDVLAFSASLTQLRGMKVDLWLPATPTDDQNANLYDNDWEHIIADDLLVVKWVVSRPRKD